MEVMEVFGGVGGGGGVFLVEVVEVFGGVG